MANKWVADSLELAWKCDYLDQLMAIYPAVPGMRERLPKELKVAIQRSFSLKEGRGLLETILSARKQKYPFPLEHPYAALLGGLPEKTKKLLLDKNPRVVGTIAKILFSMGVQNVVKGMERAPDINRQLGAAFRGWLRREFSNKKGYSFQQDLVNCPKGKITFFDGADMAIEAYIKTDLGIVLPNVSFKRDLLVNINGLIIVGEARFLSTSGGSQTRDIGNTLNFVRTVNESSIKNLKAIAMIDGVVWFNTSYKRIMSSVPDSVPVMSALLLEQYLQEIKEARETKVKK